MKKSIDYSVMPGFEECLPRITLIVSYSSRRKSQAELSKLLSLEADKIEKDLVKNYCSEKTIPIIKRLRHLIEGISLKDDGKSIGIFISPCSENVYYFKATETSELYTPSVLVEADPFQANYPPRRKTEI